MPSLLQKPQDHIKNKPFPMVIFPAKHYHKNEGKTEISFLNIEITAQSCISQCIILTFLDFIFMKTNEHFRMSKKPRLDCQFCSGQTCLTSFINGKLRREHLEQIKPIYSQVIICETVKIDIPANLIQYPIIFSM